MVGAAPFTVGSATYSNFVYGGITPPTSVNVVASTNSAGESVITFTRNNWGNKAQDNIVQPAEVLAARSK